MSRISRYQSSVSKFIENKTLYFDYIKSSLKNDKVKQNNFLNINDHEISIILMTVLNNQIKKNNIKSFHGYYLASSIDLLMSVVFIRDNMSYYENLFNKKLINNLLNLCPVYFNDGLTQNFDSLDNVEKDKDKVIKIQKMLSNYTNKKLVDILRKDDYYGSRKVHKTDIVRYRFSDKNIINDKYKNITLLEQDTLLDYIDRTYGYVCQLSFVYGWIFGFGDEKAIPQLEKAGSSFGLLLKIATDFDNIDRDINFTNGGMSHNLIVNIGIHKCFELFNECKIKVLSSFYTFDLYNITVKEVIDFIEKKFDTKLNNTDLEMESKYSSFS